MHKESSAARLASLAVGGRLYLDTTPERYPSDMRIALVPRSRRPAELSSRKFRAQVLTALGFSLGDIRYLICIERVA